MPKFTDSEGFLQNQKPGDYVLRVVSFEKGLSKGAKTSGADKYDLKIMVENPDAKQPSSYLHEQLIDTESLLWKWDTFLKSCGVEIKKGESYSFDEDDAREQGVKFISIIGLRGWATIRMKSPENSNESPKWNEVAAWLTNKPKLPRYVEPAQDPEWT